MISKISLKEVHRYLSLLGLVCLIGVMLVKDLLINILLISIVIISLALALMFYKLISYSKDVSFNIDTFMLSTIKTPLKILCGILIIIIIILLITLFLKTF